MADVQFGWSRAALLQLLLGVSLMAMPPTQARSLRFVTLVKKESVAKGLARPSRAQACWWREGARLVLGLEVWQGWGWGAGLGDDWLEGLGAWVRN